MFDQLCFRQLHAWNTHSRPGLRFAVNRAVASASLGHIALVNGNRSTCTRQKLNDAPDALRTQHLQSVTHCGQCCMVSLCASLSITPTN